MKTERLNRRKSVLLKLRIYSMFLSIIYSVETPKCK